MTSTPRRFGLTLHDYLSQREEYVSGSGNINLQEFARTLPSYHYETLRKAVVGDRSPTVELIEEVARSLGVSPSVFFEYDLLLAQQSFDPRVVGLDAALANLEQWQESGGKAQPSKVTGKRRRRGGPAQAALA